HAAVQNRGQEVDVYFTRLNKPALQVQPDDKTRRTSRFGMSLPSLQEWQNEPRWEDDRFCCRTADLACRWLEDNYKAPKWMLWLEFFDVHEPWDPPEYFWRRHDPGYDGPEMRHPNYGPAGEYTAAELRNLQAHYAGEVELMDKCVGRILRQIEDCGIDDDTAIVFTADHGIAVGEHNRTGKSNIHPDDKRAWLMFEELAHIPLIVHLPGMRPRKVRRYVQPVDLTATLLDIAAAEPDPDADGSSALGLATGSADSWRRAWAISSGYLGGLSETPSGLPMLYAGKWAYCPRTDRMGTGGVLYDMGADRAQKTNLARGHPAVAARMRRQMKRLLSEMGVAGESIGALMGEA
ncbi:MAG: sulfatase family protein, partial [Planctomycetota bacterium]